MGQRIAELEDALAELQAQVSHEKHPLLREKLLIINAPVSTVNATSSLKGTSDGVAALLGTLTIGDRANFVGPAADSDVSTRASILRITHLLNIFFVLRYRSISSCATRPSSRPVRGLTALRAGGQRTGPRWGELRVAARDLAHGKHLPVHNRTPHAAVYHAAVIRVRAPRNRRVATLGALLREVDVDVQPHPEAGVHRDDLLRHLCGRGTVGGRGHTTRPRCNVQCVLNYVARAAVLKPCKVVFAIACITDLSRPPYNAEAANYYQLARVAIGIDSPIDHPTLQAVRAIVSLGPQPGVRCSRFFVGST